MKYISLTQDKQAIVDDDDYDRLSKYKWHYHNKGYAARYTSRKEGKRRLLLMHREILDTSLENNNGDMHTDHINGIRLDNRRENLRLCNRHENCWNTAVARKNNKSGYKGIFWDAHKQKWEAHLKYYGKHVFIGYFDTPISAALAYDNKARELFGKFARTNF